MYRNGASVGRTTAYDSGLADRVRTPPSTATALTGERKAWEPPAVQSEMHVLYVEGKTESPCHQLVWRLRMTLYFQDAYGKRGRISDSLDVSYTGYWEEEVTGFVEGMRDDGSIEDEGCAGLDEVNDLLIELPEEFPIREISRVDF